MTRDVFLKCYNSMHNKKTTFGGGTVIMNSGTSYNHVIKMEFDVDNDTISVFYLDINHRKRVQDYAQSWIAQGKNLKDFIYPTLMTVIDRRFIKHIDYPKVIIQLMLPFYD